MTTTAVNFDDIQHGPPPSLPPSTPPRSGGGGVSPKLQTNPNFYSLAHGFSSDEEEKEQQKPIHATPPSIRPDSTHNTVPVPSKESAQQHQQRPPSIPPPHEVPLSQEMLNVVDPPKVDEGTKVEQPTMSPVSEQKEETSPDPRFHQNSPPPIYSTVYPPGIYPTIPGQLPCYGAPPYNGRAYVINANALNGMPAVLIHQGYGDPLGTAGPVLIISDRYTEWARRRRALALVSCFLLLFPMLSFLMMILLSTSFNY